MVLDEPTNDLDIETLDLLQELLGDYRGNDPDRQPRSRFSRPGRDLGDRQRGRWALGRICRRLFRHGRAARLWTGGPASGARAAKAERPDKRPADRAAPRRKLGFNEKRALEALPPRIEAIRAELDALESKLADADFPVREPAAFMDATKSYAELREALAGAEDEWLGLEILREELERQ